MPPNPTNLLPFPEEYQPYADALLAQADDMLRHWIWEFIKLQQTGDFKDVPADQVILLAAHKAGESLQEFVRRNAIR